MNNKNKIILHLCADIGSDSQPYVDAGYDVRRIGKDMSIENYSPPPNVYGIIANPPCTHFSTAKTTGEHKNMYKGMHLVKECLRVIWECQYRLESDFSQKTPLKFWMIENPRGLLRYFLGKPALSYTPWEYGDPYQKQTDIWGNFNIPKKIFKHKKEVMTQTEIDLAYSNSLRACKKDDLTKKYKGLNNKRSVCSPKFAQAFFDVNR